jgi:hypothetical protein
VGCAACIRGGNDPTGVWGLWKIAPNKKLWHPRAGGLYALLLRRASFFSRAARECEATRPGKARSFYRRRAAGRQPRLLPAGAVAEPQVSITKGSVRAGACPASIGGAGDRTERAAVRKNEERKKHDRLSAFYQAAEALFYSLKKQLNS